MGATTNIEKKGNEAVDLYRNDAFESGFYTYFADLKNNKISKILNNKERNVKLESVTYRQLNSWEKEGLLIGDREGRGWRRFTILDAIWVRIIKELREFGMGWEQLKITKQSLEFESAKCGVAMPLLEFYTAFAIGNKMPVLLLVFKDGVAVPANYSQYKIAREFKSIENHLQINLNEILQSFFPNADLKPKYKGELPLDIGEVELLAFLRVANYEKIEVRYKNGKIDLIEGVERFKACKKIHDILKEQQFATIEVVQENGEIVEYVRKTKKKIKRDAP